MANIIKLRRSATQGAVPTTSQLALGELAMNTYDGKLYVKTNKSGSESIVEVGASGAGAATAKKFDDISSSFNGSLQTFNITVNSTAHSPADVNATIISLGGVTQEPTTSYSISGSTITFSSPPASGLDFYGIDLGAPIPIGVPNDGSVTTAKLDTDLTIDLASGTATAPSLTFDSNTGLYSPGADQVALATNGTERMRISANGTHWHYGDTTAGIFSTNQASAGSTAVLAVRYGATSITSGTNSFFVFPDGDVQNTNDSYGAISDIKLKENIVDAESQWDDFKAVRFRKYNFKEETGHETFTQLGVIAQELELVSPGLVTETPDLDEDGNDLGTTTKSVKYSVLTKKALVALQEAMERIETLEASNADLIARVTALEGN